MDYRRLASADILLTNELAFGAITQREPATKEPS